MTTLISRLILATISVSSLLFLPIGSCTREYESCSYISQYSIIDHIQIEPYVVNNSDSSHLLTFRFILDGHVSVASKGEDKQLYNKICNINGDTSHCGTVEKSGAYISGGSAFYPNISAINITCNIDFDANHPAGTSLNDCFEIEYSHYEQFNDDGFVQKRKKISEIENINYLTTNMCDIHYITLPKSKKDAIITLTVTMNNGKVFEAKCNRMI